MSDPKFARLLVAAAVAVTLAACSGQSPAAPGELFSAQGGAADARGSTGVPGVYTLSFFANGQDIWSLPVSTASLVIRAQVTDTSGNPAPLGSVTFEYCSYGGRTNDITNADEATKEACEQGLAKWVRLGARSIEGGGNCPPIYSGSACFNFGVVRIPRSIGFRFRYAQQKSSIAGGTSEAIDFLWVPKS